MPFTLSADSREFGDHQNNLFIGCFHGNPEETYIRIHMYVFSGKSNVTMLTLDKL